MALTSPAVVHFIPASMTVVMLLFAALMSLAPTLGANKIGKYAYAEEQNPNAHFNAGIDIFSDPGFETQGWKFIR